MLESVAELSQAPTTFPIPTKGTYITFKSGGGTHEAHVSVRSVASVALSTEPAKMGGHDLHVMRLLGVGGGPVLSLLVAWAEGEGPGSYVRCFLSDYCAIGWAVGAFPGRWLSLLTVGLASMLVRGSGCGLRRGQSGAGPTRRACGDGKPWTKGVHSDDALVQKLTTTGT